MIAFVAGVFIGSFMGFLTAALIVAGRRGEDD